MAQFNQIKDKEVLVRKKYLSDGSDDFFNYKKYIASAHWKRTRKQKLEQVGYFCEKCGLEEGLCVHHLHYNSLGMEEMSDLQVLCRECHRKTHSGQLGTR